MRNLQKAHKQEMKGRNETIQTLSERYGNSRANNPTLKDLLELQQQRQRQRQEEQKQQQQPQQMQQQQQQEDIRQLAQWRKNKDWGKIQKFYDEKKPTSYPWSGMAPQAQMQLRQEKPMLFETKGVPSPQQQYPQWEKEQQQQKNLQGLQQNLQQPPLEKDQYGQPYQPLSAREIYSHPYQSLSARDQQLRAQQEAQRQGQLQQQPQDLKQRSGQLLDYFNQKDALKLQGQQPPAAPWSLNPQINEQLWQRNLDWQRGLKPGLSLSAKQIKARQQYLQQQQHQPTPQARQQQLLMLQQLKQQQPWQEQEQEQEQPLQQLSQVPPQLLQQQEQPLQDLRQYNVMSEQGQQMNQRHLQGSQERLARQHKSQQKMQPWLAQQQHMPLGRPSGKMVPDRNLY